MNPNPAKDGSFTRSDDGVFPSLYDMLSGGHLPTPDSDDGQSYLHPKLRLVCVMFYTPHVKNISSVSAYCPTHPGSPEI